MILAVNHGVYTGINMESKLKISFLNHLNALVSIFILFAILLIALVLLKFNYSFLFIFSIGFALDAVPALFLHFEYWLENKKANYEILFDRIILLKHGERTTYHLNDIEKIVLYKSASIDKGGIPILAIEPYHFARIITKTSEELIITCLLTSKVEEAIRQLKGIPIERKKRIFCTLSWK